MYSKLKQDMKAAGFPVTEGAAFLHTDNVLSRDFFHFHGGKLEDYVGVEATEETSADEQTEGTGDVTDNTTPPADTGEGTEDTTPPSEQTDEGAGEGQEPTEGQDAGITEDGVTIPVEEGQDAEQQAGADAEGTDNAA